jgi:anti-sigma B factor antagonist
MEISTKPLKRVEVISVSGRVDSSTAPEFEQALKGALDAGRHHIVLDLQNVDYMSSAGLRAMVAALKTARRHNGDVRVANPSARVTEVLQLAGLTSIFEVFPTQVDAVGSF